MHCGESIEISSEVLGTLRVILIDLQKLLYVKSIVYNFLIEANQLHLDIGNIHK